MRDVVSIKVSLGRKTRHATAAALEAVADAVRKGDVTTIPYRYTMGGLDLEVIEHDTLKEGQSND